MSDALVERRIYQLDLVVNTSTWWYMRSVTRLVFGTSKVVRTEIVTSGYWNRIYCQVSVGTSLLLYEGSDVIRRTISLTVCLCLCLCLLVRLFVYQSVCLSIRLSVCPSVRLSLCLLAECLYFSLKECNINQQYIRFKRYVMAACGYKSIVECFYHNFHEWPKHMSERRYQQEEINSPPHVAMYALVPNMTEYWWDVWIKGNLKTRFKSTGCRGYLNLNSACGDAP